MQDAAAKIGHVALQLPGQQLDECWDNKKIELRPDFRQCKFPIGPRPETEHWRQYHVDAPGTIEGGRHPSRDPYLENQFNDALETLMNRELTPSTISVDPGTLQRLRDILLQAQVPGKVIPLSSPPIALSAVAPADQATQWQLMRMIQGRQHLRRPLVDYPYIDPPETYAIGLGSFS